MPMVQLSIATCSADHTRLFLQVCEAAEAGAAERDSMAGAHLTALEQRRALGEAAALASRARALATDRASRRERTCFSGPVIRTPLIHVKESVRLCSSLTG